MRREGRVHGLVRTHVILPDPLSDDSTEKTLVSKSKRSVVPLAGAFAKVPRKPTNHSKFTGKCHKQMCMSCHNAPSSKSKNKSKGARKFQSVDYLEDYDGEF